jgi:hypothetical protein
MMKLNGWKRIGIIASVVWILGAGEYTCDSEYDHASFSIASTHFACESVLTTDPIAHEKQVERCDKIADESFASALTNARLAGALVAFVPVPLGWGFTYLVIFLVRWVRRGFTRPSSGVF